MVASLIEVGRKGLQRSTQTELWRGLNVGTTFCNTVYTVGRLIQFNGFSSFSSSMSFAITRTGQGWERNRVLLHVSAASEASAVGPMTMFPNEGEVSLEIPTHCDESLLHARRGRA